MKNTHRRQFLRQGLLTGALLATPRRVLAVASANEQINLGVIGLGWRGGQLVEAFSKLPNTNIAAICDPDSELVGQCSDRVPHAKACADLRDLLELPEIDAVAIATCNHWHCLAAQWALEAGKHVYVEKPLCNALWEGRQVVNAARKRGLICQIGTQQRSSPMQNEIKQLLHEQRVLGEIEWVRVNRYGIRASIGKRETPLQPPPTLDYNLWLGPAQDLPIYREKLHYDWHWDWNTGAGEMGNWGVHVVDDVRNNVFLDKTEFPQRIVAAGGRFGWHDAGNTPNVHLAVFDTGEIPVVLGLTNLPQAPGSKQTPKCPAPDTGYIVYCSGGRLEGQRGSAKLYDDSGKLIKDLRGSDGMGLHQQNFLDAIRNSSPNSLNAPVEQGHYSSGWCTLANYAYRVIHDTRDQSNSQSSLEDLDLENTPKSTASRLLDSLNQLVARHEGAEAPHLTPGPVLSFDTESEQFIGDQADIANRFLRVEGRGDFAVQPA